MTPSLDIAIAVYNHAAFLRQALDSVLSQKTTFPFRIIVGDDHSTDGSTEILKEYLARYPDKISVIFQEKNIGVGKNTSNGNIVLNSTTANYVAILDGDDYWIDPLKLQKQVDFLETNPDFSFCYHHVKVVHEGTFENNTLEMKTDQPEISSIEAILKKTIWPHINSVVYRRESMPKCPDWLAKCPSTDWAILAIITGDKKIKYMNETMSAYRQHGGGIWSGNSVDKKYLRTLESAHILKKYLIKGEDRKYLYWPVSSAYAELIKLYKSTKPLKAFYYFILLKREDFNYFFTIKKESLKNT